MSSFIDSGMRIWNKFLFYKMNWESNGFLVKNNLLNTGLALDEYTHIQDKPRNAVFVRYVTKVVDV